MILGIIQQRGLSLPKTDFNKIAITYNSFEITLFQDGQEIEKVSGSFDFSAFSSVLIGHDSGGSNYLNGHVRTLAYYPKRLSDEELKKLTNPV